MITQELRYAMVLIQEIENSEQKTVREVAEKYGLSVKFLEQVAGKLRRAGLITAKRGNKGGYVAALKSLSLSQIFSALGREPSAVSCKLSDDCRGGAMCTEREMEAKIVGEMNDEMARLVISS